MSFKLPYGNQTNWGGLVLVQASSGPPVVTDAIAVAHNITGIDFIASVYPWSSSGFGTEFSNPSTLSDAGYGVAFTNTQNALAITSQLSPFVRVYAWSGSGFGTQFSNPATLPTGLGAGVAFTRADDAIAVAHATTPFITAYPWSSSGFGAKFSNPATLPSNFAPGVAFN